MIEYMKKRCSGIIIKTFQPYSVKFSMLISYPFLEKIKITMI
jgi:hypothetical protein